MSDRVMESGDALRTEGLTKLYGEVTAVSQLSFSLEKGTMCALVGPDGAGKTTTIRMLCGIIAPTSGRAEILGYDTVKDRSQLKRKIGYLSQGFSLYEDLSVDENIEFFAEIHKVRNYTQRRNQLLEFTRLAPFHKRLAGKLSGGMKKKLALACTLVHRPEIIFLDEPTTGVDPVSRRDFWLILAEVLKEGISILISTPYLDEAERCSSVGMLSQGTMLAMDTPGGMRRHMRGSIVEFVVPRVREAVELLPRGGEPWCQELQLFGDRFDVLTDDVYQTKEKITVFLKQRGISVLDAREVTPSLENVFISMLQKRESA